MSRGVLGAVLAIVAMLIVSPLPAHAYTPTQNQGIGEWAIRGGAQPAGQPCGTVCTQLYLSEHRPIPNQPASRLLHQELAQLRSNANVRTMPTLTQIGTRALPVVAAGATSAWVGYKIGTAFRNSWVITTNPNLGLDTAPVWTQYIFKSKGEGILNVNGAVVNAPEIGFQGFNPLANPTDHREQVVYDAGTFPECDPLEFPALPDFGGSWSTFSVMSNYFDNCGEGFLRGSVAFTGLYAQHPDDVGKIGALTVDALPPGVPEVGTLTNGSNPTPGNVQIGVVNELAGPNYPMLNDWLAHEFDPTNNPDPLVVPVPDCTGLSYNACITALQDAGYGVFERSNASFEEAIPMPQGQPDQVLSTSPAAGATPASSNVTITIEANPPEEEMPRLIPSLRGMTESEATTTVIQLGGVPTIEVLTPELSEPHLGSSTVTSPDTPTRIGLDAPVTIRVNPPGLPPTTGDGGCEPWASPSINFGPLAAIPFADVFPFAVPFYIFEALEDWVGTPVTPSWDFHFPFAGEGDNWHVDLAMFDPHMPAIRAVLLVASLLAMAWFFLSLAVGAPSSRSEG